MNKTELKYSFLLFIAALIWGTAFVFQAIGMEHIGPLAFTTGRSFIGFLFLIPVAIFTERYKKRTKSREVYMIGPFTKAELLGGFICGTVLCAASNFQQVGIQYTTVTKAGFLTALYVILVPLLGILLKHRVPGYLFVCAGISVVGLYFLCLFGKDLGGDASAFGDLLELICAFIFAIQILCVAHFSMRCRGIILSCLQFLVCGLETLLLTFIYESPTWSGILDALPSLLYVGVLSSGVAYTLQIITERHLHPTVASLIMCLESVISAIAGWILLSQIMTASEIFGASLMFGAIVLAQVLPSIFPES